MTVGQALQNRFSCRSFLEQEVPREILKDVLKAAFHSPSCENSQPWKVFIAGSQVMKQLRAEYESNRKARIRPDLDRRFDGKWTKEMLPRIDEYFEGICEHEPHKNMDYTMQKRNLFYAPTMIFFCMDEELPTWPVFDTGIFAQSLMLSATEHELATIPAAVFVGYPDASVKVNHFKSSRKPISEIVYKVPMSFPFIPLSVTQTKMFSGVSFHRDLVGMLQVREKSERLLQLG